VWEGYIRIIAFIIKQFTKEEIYRKILKSRVTYINDNNIYLEMHMWVRVEIFPTQINPLISLPGCIEASFPFISGHTLELMNCDYF
jgi:hypothetical protein